MPRADSNKSSTALRALLIMEFLAGAGRPVSVTEVASAIGADRSTAYRMLMTLLDAGYVRRDQTLKSYQLGYKLLSLTKGLLNEGEKTELVAEALRRIAARTGETAHYCVLDGDASILVQRAKGAQLVAVDFDIGDRAPLHCTAIGKVLLAWLDARSVDIVISAGLKRMAAKTIIRADRLRAELRTVRAQGYAFDDREFHDDMRCVAVPVFEKSGTPPAGISISGPTSRFTLARLKHLRREMAEEADELSRKFGGLG